MTAFAVSTASLSATASLVECVNKQFPANIGSAIQMDLQGWKALGNVSLYYDDGVIDPLYKTWAQYNVSKLQINFQGKGVYFLQWGGGSSTSPSDPKHVPMFMVLYPLTNGNVLRLGIIEQKPLGPIFQNIETIYNYVCKKMN